MFEILQDLCALDGISGREQKVHDYILKKLDGYCEVQEDALGNIMVFKRGEKRAKQKILLSAHMDEVGFMVQGIEEDGRLRFCNVGGIMPAVTVGARVRLQSGREGIIGSKPIHLLNQEERKAELKTEDLFIDIGAKDLKDAEKYVHLGDAVHFLSDWKEFGNHMVKAKAIDDRFGCAVLIRLLLEEKLPMDLYVSFVTQEEVGLRGAKTAAFTVQPDIGIVIEATTASDIPGACGSEKICEVGAGAVISFMDKHTIYDQALMEMTLAVAQKKEIPAQVKRMAVGGNDAGAISLAGKGARCLGMSLPCRYIHSPSCVASKKDMQSLYQLLIAVLGELGNDN